MKKHVFILFTIFVIFNTGCAGVYKFMGIATAADMKTVNETLDSTLTDQQKKNASLVQELKSEIDKLKKEVIELQKTAAQMEQAIALAQDAQESASESAKKILAFEKRLQEVQKRVDQAATDSLRLLDALLQEYLENVPAAKEPVSTKPIKVEPLEDKPAQ